MGVNDFLKQPENIAAVTTVSLVILGVIQIILGETISKSVALTANGIDCIGDGFVSAVVWFGLRMLRRPADDKFHFGYYKMENAASLIAAIVMIALAVYIVYRSILQLSDPHPIEFPIVGAAVALFAAFVSWSLGAYKYFKVDRQHYGSVRLDAFNTVKDGTASFLTVIALLLGFYGYPIADAIVGFIIAGIIVTIGFAAIKESGYMLVDACDHSCLEQQGGVRGVAESVEGVIEAHIVRLRRSGPVILGEIEIIVDGGMSVEELYHIRQQIHDKIKQQFHNIEGLTITAKPQKKKKSI